MTQRLIHYYISGPIYPGTQNPERCAGDAREYSARISTRHGYQTVRLPFSSFRATNALDPQLDPADVAHVAVRYEPRQRMAATILGQEDIASQCALYYKTLILKPSNLHRRIPFPSD